VAISNHRLVDMTDDTVSFRWKDYRHGGRVRTLTLEAEEFLRRFLAACLAEALRAHPLLRFPGLTLSHGTPVIRGHPRRTRFLARRTCRHCPTSNVAALTHAPARGARTIERT